MSNSLRVLFIFIALLAPVATAPPAADAQPLNAIQQKCVTKVISRGARVAKSEGKEVRSCLRDGAVGVLDAVTGPACWTRDLRGKIAAAKAKTTSTAQSLCTGLVPYGYANAAEINDAAVEESAGVSQDLFGPDLSVGAISALNSFGSGCQQRVQKAYEKVAAAKLRSFQKCLKTGLKVGAINAATGIETCIISTVPDSSNATVGKQVTKLVQTVASRCSGTNYSTAFPQSCGLSANTGELSTCIGDVVDCRVCTMLKRMSDLEIDCDELDDGSANGTCPGGAGPPSGVCLNPADEAVVASVDIQAETTTCTFGCLASGDVPQCISDCLNAATGLSTACGLCYGASSQCGIANCASDCILDPAGEACLACIDIHCIPAFNECASGPPSSTTTTTTTTTMGNGTTTTTSTTMPVALGACMNPNDEAIEMSIDVQAETTTCTISCLGSGNLPQCVADCLVNAIGLTGACANCYGGSAACGLANCAAECAADQSAPACQACLEANCIPAFDLCASAPTTTTTTLDTTTTTTTTITTTTTTTTLPGGQGACTNAADLATLAVVDQQAETTTCTFGCLGAGDIAQCVADCVELATGLSPACSLCYGNSAECGIQNCAAQCAIDPQSAACLACVDANCIPAFDVCTGDLGPTTTTTTTTLDTTTTTTTTTTTLPPSGACDNPADESVATSFDLEAEAVPCTVSCLSNPNLTQCVAACLVSGTGLSSNCAQCYANSSECGLQNCAGVCAVDQQSIPCRTCLDEFCIPAFDACSGLGEPPPPATCSDGMLNGDETDLDCGGSCADCPLGSDCSVGSDCVSGECVGSVCSGPSSGIGFDSCLNGYIDPFADPDGIDLAAPSASGSDDGYVLQLASAQDVFIELTNQTGSTTLLEAALVTTPGDAGTAVAGLSTGPVVAGQNGTSGPTTVAAGTYYLYVDSAVADTFGPYSICVLPAPGVALDTCVTGSVGNGDGDDISIIGAGGDRALRFTAPSTTNAIVRLRNLSGTSTMAAAVFNGATPIAGSQTPDAFVFTERTTAPFTVPGGTQLTVHVDTSTFDTFGNYELCISEAGCGDGIVLGSEVCDDGNQTNGDGCSSSCNLESGQMVTDSCRSDSIPLFGNDCDTFNLPIHTSEEIFLELTNDFGDTLLAIGRIKQGGTTLASTGNVPVAQTGSTANVFATAGSNLTVEVCDVTGLGTGSYDVCVRSARRIELGTCFSSNVADGDGNAIDLAGPISGGDEAVIFQPPFSTNAQLTLFNEGGGGLLAAGIYDGQPGSLVGNSAAGASPSPVPVGGSAQGGLTPVNGGQVYRVYTDVATLGTAGTDYTICLAEVLGDNCLNPEDETVRASYNLAAEAESLGLSCTGNASCISTGLQNNTGMSAACADCYGGVGGCAASNCALNCLNSSSSGCLSCVESNCAAEFEICSGWVYGG